MAILNNLIVNGAARFLNKTYFDTISANTIDANEGIFKKLVAKNSTLTDVTVVGLMDVTGELHTKSFTNSNIATIDGSFYITPTLGLQGANTTTNTVTVTANSLSFANASGTSFSFESLYLENTTSPVAWSTGSSVIVTGEIQDKTTNEWMPLGTLKGTLSTYSTTSVVINSIKDSANGTAPATLAAIVASGTTSGLKYRNIKVSLVSINRSGLKPLGIFMTATGSNGRTFLDIYGGNNAEANTYGGLSTPVLRIGNLNGLPALTLPNNTSVAPAGWGIYTTNGFFSGTIVSTQGKIGNFTLGTAIYGATSGSGPSTISATTAGTYLGTDGFRNNNSSDTTKYAQITNGILTAQGAEIQGTLKAGAGSTIGPWTVSSNAIYNPSTKSSLSSDTIDGVYLGKDGITLGKGVFKVTSVGALTAKSGTIGGISMNSSYGLYTNSKTSATSTNTGFLISKDGGIYLGAYDSSSGVVSCPFQVTSAGVLTARSGRIGKFNLTNTYLSTGSGSTMVGMGGNQAFWAGNSSSDSAPFRVSYAGVLNATGATLTNLTIKNSATGTPTIGTFDTNGITLYDQAGTQRIKITSSGGVVIGKASGKGRIEVTDSGMNIYNASGTQTSSFGDSITLGSNAATVTIGKVAANNYNTVINNQGMTINDNATPIAQFSSSGARIGKTGVGYIDIKSTGLDIYSGNNNVNLVHFGYDSGTNEEGGTSVAPYYTLGTRKSNSAIGNFSIAGGVNTTASGYISYAEGLDTKATGYYSHAEGVSTEAQGESSHAEGSGTWAKGDWSHAEGGASHAKGEYSHAGGYGCKAESNASFAMGYKVTAYGPYQTAIGKYNTTDTSKAFIIGNGTSETALSNAFTVDWSGNVKAKGRFYASSNSDSSGGSVVFDAGHTIDTNSTCLPQFSGKPSYLVGIEAFASGGTMKWQSTDGIRVGYANNLVLPGVITMYAGSTAPTGWLLCDGSAVSRTTYSELYAVIGTTYGSGNGSSTFNLPDLRGRAPIGAGTGSGLTARTLGTQNIGSENAIIPYHRHSVSAVSDGITGGSHNHDMRRTQSATATSGSNRYFASGSVESGFTTSSETHTHNLPAHNTNYAGTSGNTTGANMQPSAVVNFIICTGKTS